MNNEYMKEYMKNYWKTHPDKYERQKQRVRENSHHRYENDLEYRQKSIGNWKKYRKKDPSSYKDTRRMRAYTTVYRHPELLFSQCELCPSIENLLGHHPDYDYPTIVVTCCKSCHRNIHKND
jgi:hypothetical protein